MGVKLEQYEYNGIRDSDIPSPCQVSKAEKGIYKISASIGVKNAIFWITLTTEITVSFMLV